MTTPDDVLDINPDRLRQLIADALGRLDKQDLAERIAWSITNNVHGALTYVSDDGTVDVHFGGRLLLAVHIDVLRGDGPLDDVDATFIPDDLDTEIEGLEDDE
jgi:hypothetical protein